MTEKGQPEETKIWIYSLLLRLYHLSPRLVRDIVETTFLRISLTVPSGLLDSRDRSDVRRAAAVGVVGGWVFYLAGCVVAAILTGRWSGDEPGWVYLSNDIPNLINYTVLVPGHLACGLSLIAVAAQVEPRELALRPEGAGRWRPWPAVGLSLLFSFLVVSLYIGEGLSTEVYTAAYWWVAGVLEDGTRIFDAFSAYYVMLNFALCFVVALGACSFATLMLSALKVGRDLRAEPIEGAEQVTLAQLRSRLSVFSDGYVLAKLQAGFLMLNCYTFRAELIEDSVVMHVAGGITALYGVFFISVPRYFVELEWHLLSARLVASGKSSALANDDVRSRNVRAVAFGIDVLLGGGFIFGFWTLFPRF